MFLKDSKTRLDYIDKETDTESHLGDYGVRNCDSFTGRFITPDVLFEKYAGWSPYHYSLDNPVSYKDGNGYKVSGTHLYNYDAAIEYFISKGAYEAASLLIEYKLNDIDIRISASPKKVKGSSMQGSKSHWYNVDWYPNTALKSKNHDNEDIYLSPQKYYIMK